MNHKVALTLVFVLLLVGAFASAPADSWALPKKETYYSPKKNYYLEVTPKKLQSQLKYFEDKVEGKNNAGAVRGEKENRAKGAFYARGADGAYSKKSEFPLLNEVSPVSAIVSSKGDYFVTFDNWHRMGYGDDAIVIYHSNGNLVKKLGLEDVLTEDDIKKLPRSVSSIWWGGKHYLEEAKGLLVLKIVSNRTNPWEEGAAFRELKIELATGRLLQGS